MLLGNLDLNKIGDRIRTLDRFLINVLKVRLSNGGLSEAVAENKRKQSYEENHDGVFPKKRPQTENERIESMKKWAIHNGIDQNFAAGLLYNIMSESCRVQDDIMVEKHHNHAEVIDEKNLDAVYKYQRDNLISLARAVAPNYDKDYGEGFFGSKLYFSFEKNIIQEIIRDIPQKTLAVDLGCATGMISFEIAQKFDSVYGFDISPAMVECATNKITDATSHVKFKKYDLEEGLDLPENSVSLAIMNMGTASEIRNFKGFLESLQKCLAPDGKFFLSFYNSESLLSKIGFVPWPMPLSACIDAEKRCLEVQHANKFYSLYARSRSVKEVEDLLSNFEIDSIQTFPTLGSLLPNVLMENEDKDGVICPNNDVRKTVKKIDLELSQSAIHSGTYIIVTGGKKNVV